MQVGSFDHLLMVAHEEMATAQGELPEALQAGARSVPVTFEPSPNTGFVADGIAPDTLGLFLGESLADGRAAIRSRLRSFSFSKTSGNSPAPMRRRIAKRSASPTYTSSAIISAWTKTTLKPAVSISLGFWILV